MTAASIGNPPRATHYTMAGGAWAWGALLAIAAACLALKTQFPWLVNFPADWTLPLAASINVVTDAVVPVVQPAFRAVSAVLDWPMRSMRQGLIWLPWPAVMLAVTALALKAGGGRLALFAV